MEWCTSDGSQRCDEARDRKGVYEAASAGNIEDFSGIDDPHEVPKDPEIHLETVGRTADECEREVLLKLIHLVVIK